MPDRLIATPAAQALIERLRQSHGDVLFHLSGGCCDGSAPMCFRQDEFKLGSRDVLLGHVAQAPFYVGPAIWEYWRHSQMIIDVAAGRGGSFSLEAPEGMRFIARSRLFSDEELAQVPPVSGPPGV